MIRSLAALRIADGLGFRPLTSGMPGGRTLEDVITARIQEAQRILETGTTLPRFLREEDHALTLLEGEHTVALPTGFIREVDSERPHFTPVSTSIPKFLEAKFYDDAVAAQIREQNDPVAPAIYVIRKSVIDFITTADQDYTIYMTYFKAGASLATDIENVWLANAPDWLIGETGLRIAMDLRDKDAISIFTTLQKTGRSATFGEHLLDETSGGPLQMGADL